MPTDLRELRAGDGARRSISLALRGRGTVGEWTTRLRQELGQALPGAVLMDVKPLSRYADEGIARDRMLALLCGYFGLVALLLTAIGIYGLMSQSVAQRTAEIGVRMAFGAERRQVQWLVLRESLPLVAAGLAAGAIATMATTRVAERWCSACRPAARHADGAARVDGGGRHRRDRHPGMARVARRSAGRAARRIASRRTLRAEGRTAVTWSRESKPPP